MFWLRIRIWSMPSRGCSTGPSHCRYGGLSMISTSTLTEIQAAFCEGTSSCGLLRNRYAHALIMLDREGCGQETRSREELEDVIGRNLSVSGWGERGVAVVIDPELEGWVWGDSPHLGEVLGWSEELGSLRLWMNKAGFLAENHVKPSRPKEALETVLRTVRRPRSASIYLQLAQRVSVNRCIDPAFSKFRTTLRQWFPPEE